MTTTYNHMIKQILTTPNTNKARRIRSRIVRRIGWDDYRALLVKCVKSA